MSKKDNKRFNDKERKTAPKRVSKSRRVYGADYEEGRRDAKASTKKSRGSEPVMKRGANSKRDDARRVLGFDMDRRDIYGTYEGRNAREALESVLEVGANGLEIVAGRNPVTETLNGSREVEHVFIADGAEGSVSKIVAIAREQGVIVDFVPKARIDAMAPDAKHQGVVAKVSAYHYADIEDIFAMADKAGEDPFIVLLDGIEDPHNLGAIIRTAECAGAHGVVIPKRRSASLTQTVALSAAGAIERVPVARVTNLARTIEELQARDVWVGAADMDGEIYYTADLSGPIGIVIGNEGKGVGRLVKSKCDFALSIPMYGEINSLNASNAAAVLMYGIRRARG